MTIHKEGYTTIFLSIIVLGTLVGVTYYFSDIVWLNALIYLTALVLFTLVLQFFRSPSRNWVSDKDSVICPADGEVVVIEETEENEYFQAKRIQVSIFMSPLNVHANRNPISGVVTFAKYHAGKYLMAINPKSSTENERTTIAIKHENGKEVLFRQIAGALARRIVYYVAEGDQVEQSKEFGFIKFGSRVDVFLPLDSEVAVKLGDKVKGGITKLAKL